MTKDEVIKMAREAAFHTPVLEAELLRFAALIEEHLKDQGYRQCAKGQRTTQFCGMLEQAVRAEREECAKVCNDYDYPSECAAAIRGRT